MYIGEVWGSNPHWSTMLSLGIVGLPNVGKSTLFNALTRSKQALAANYPFATIDPNVGVVEVPDIRLQQLTAISQSKKTVPTAIQFIDIAGIVKGASEGAGLGNKFLSHIREVDAIVQVVRAFEDGNIIHVNNKVDPKDDASTINLELALADLSTVTKRLDTTKKNAKGAAAKDAALEVSVLERVKAALEEGEPARTLEYTEDEMLVMTDLHLLTMKPMLYVVNTTDFNSPMPEIADDRAALITVCAKLEAELAELSLEDAKSYMQELGMMETGLDKLIVAGYTLLNLATFFTSGEPETRAWTVKRNTKAPDAAGVIHTDFIKGFIKADVVACADFVACNGWVKARETGKLRTEGKDYVVQDGDVMYFHVNT